MEVRTMPKEKIREFIAKTDYQSLPKKLVRSIRFSILDTIGAALDGCEMLKDTGQPVYTKRWSFTPKEATVIGTRNRVLAEEAFQTNTRSCSLYDQDGLQVSAAAYPGRQVILAALAAGEKLDAYLNDVITVIAISYELLIRVGYVVRDSGWPPGSPYPSKRFAAYCFTVPGVASIVNKLALPVPETGEITLVGGSDSNPQSVRDTQTATEESYNPNRRTQLSLLIETLRLLKNGTDRSFFPINITDTTVISELADKIAGLKELTYRLGQKYLLMQRGFKPALINRYLHHPLAAVKLALGNKHLDINSIQTLTLYGLSGILPALTKYNLEDTRFLMALLVVFLGAGVDPEVALVLSGSFYRDSVVRLKQKIKFDEDYYAWLNLFSGSYDFLFAAQISLNFGFSKYARVIGDIYEHKDLSTEKWVTKYFRDRTDIIGENRGQQLSDKLASSNDFVVTDLMKLTTPTWWYSTKISLGNLFTREEPEDS